ncbi:lantibiotic dehydratase [Actinocorallia sp. API 0066]|uniref:lantibiotic dehydratase n=1 Tax=Actinocorallia sp. API 0066 TaxID=2896846 RepID=UPI001E50CBBD|nr:lantibiotic dehydratase [Actinocorallia sp. API 0066]MCD0449333.1 lantibiotic dehydratase [Actinocorallia sp. API 0066]
MPPELTFRWSGSGVLRASTAPGDLELPDELDLTDPADLRRGAAWLTGLCRRPEVRAALAMASPDLLDALDHLDSGETDQRRLRRLVISTASYLLRWRHRATPFGLFAGVGTVRRGRTAVRWGDRHQVVRRPDPHWLGEVVARLHACPALLERLTVTANGALTVRGDKFVGPGPVPVDAGLAPVEVSVRATRPVRLALAKARAPVRAGELAKIVAEAFPEASSDRINGILRELVAHNLLISDLNPPMSGPDALGHVCGVLRDVAAHDVPELAGTVDELLALRHGLVPELPLNAPAALDAFVRAGSEQVRLTADTVLDASVLVPEQVGREAARAAAILCRLSPFPFGTAAWRDYHARFLDRYGTDRPVPVLELVGDGGLGFPAGYAGAAAALAPRVLTARDERLLALVQEIGVKGGELVLTDDLVCELADDEGAEPIWPDRAEIGVQVQAASREEIDRGRFALLVTGTPRSGSSMTGRHAHFLPAEARAELAASLTADDPGAIAAQLSCPPRRRGNAVLAAAVPLLDHLIPLGEGVSAGNAGEARVLGVADIAVVAASDRFRLLHQPSGRRLEIRVANALEATTHIPPLARFLSEITTARGALYAGFHFGAAQTLPYLPRVRFRRTILAPARWLLRADELPGRAAAQRTWDEAFARWRHGWNVPREVVLVEYDRRLPLDVDRPLHRHLLRSRLGAAARVELHEDLVDNGWIGRAHELLLPLRLSRPSAPVKRVSGGFSSVRHVAEPRDRRTVLKARLLSHPARWDELLTAHVPRLLAAFPESPPRWWFVRHRDLRRPDTPPALLLHFPVSAPSARGEAAEALTSWVDDLVRRNLASDVTLETFRAQPGQYGWSERSLDAAYAAFAADTVAVLAQIAFTARARIPAAAVAAVSMVDLACAFAGAPDAGRRHLVDGPPGRRGRVDPVLRDHALRLVVPEEVAAAWRDRAAALRAYRAVLETERDDPMTMLTLLLRGHHRRACDIDHERTTMRLARARALRELHDPGLSRS